MPLFARRRKPQIAGSGQALTRSTKTGTVYNAGNTALAQIPRPQLDNELGSGAPVPIRELVPELATSFQRTITYGKMMNDAGVDMSVRVIKTPILGADFYIEPYSDNPNDKLIAEFVWENLAKGMSSPFLMSLEDILKFFEDGFSVIEKVYEAREWSPAATGANTRNYTMLKKLAPRPASTIKEVIYDENGGPKQVIQNALQPDGNTKEVTLDISKIMIFTFNKTGGNVTGKSILRTAYPHWYYKNHLYKIDAIQKERHGIGIPRGTLMQGSTADDKITLRTLLRNLRSNEEAYVMQTPTITIDFVELTGNPVNVLDSASHHNTMILLNVMAQFLTLGLQTSGGGRATAGAGSDLFMKSLKHVANYVAQMINMYLIPELVVWNFPTKNFPQLKVRNIGETRDLQMFGAALANLFAQGAITADPYTEDWIRDTFDMPHKPASAAQPAPDTPVNAVDGTGAANPATNGKGNIKPNSIKTGNVGASPGSA